MASGLTVVVPAYNEEVSLKTFLPKVIEHAQRKGYSIIVVNDGSTDQTGRIIERFATEASVVGLHHKVNRGYGGAIKTGIQAAKTEFVITIDADGQHQLDDVDQMYETIVSQNADMVVGGRKGQKPASLYRGVGKWVVRAFAKILMPVPIYDINSGMKIYRTDLARQYLHLCPDSMPFSDIITLIFINQRHRVLEKPIKINCRATGKSDINTKTAFETIMEILNILVLFNPMKIFLPASLVCIIGGIIWGLPIVIRGRGVSVGAMLAIVAGLIVFFLGLIAEQLSLLRKSGSGSQANNQQNRIT